VLQYVAGIIESSDIDRIHHYNQVCVLQCVAVRCSTLQCVAVCCSLLQCVAVMMESSDHRSHWPFQTVMHVAECCSVLQSVAECCSVLQCVAECCRVLQCVAECCSVL